MLERNIPLERIREFKAAALGMLRRLAGAVWGRLPELAESDAFEFEFAGITWALLARAWPMA